VTITEILESTASVIISLGGGGAIVLGLSSYLGRLWADRALETQRQENARLNLELSHQLGLGMEQFKAQVRASADAEIERLKSALQAAALEHQIRFSKLHEKRAEVIECVYQQLVQAEKDYGHFVVVEAHEADLQKQQQARLKIEASMCEVSLYIEKHRIYLAVEVCASLKTFLQIMWQNAISVGVYGAVRQPLPQTVREQNAAVMKALEALKTELPSASAALENEFRKILGVEARHLAVGKGAT
jgi:hypothetical protein